MSTITTLRPRGQQRAGSGVTHTGGASTVAAVSDSLDTTYMTTNLVSSTVTFSLVDFAHPFTLLTTQRIVGCTIRVRNAITSGGGITQDATFSLTAWPDLSKKVATFTSQRGSINIYTLAGKQAKTPPGKITEWTAADVSRAALTVQWYQPHTGTQGVFQRIYDLWVDVEIISQASVVSPTVTNFTNNATPTVDWTFNDPDGGEQVVLEVKIFDDATVSSGGFSPDSSTPAWQSGQIASNGTEVVINQPLQNGVTYWAYVRGAKYGPQITGTDPYWWSSWTASSSFTITFTPPATPILSSTGVIVGENQYRALLSALLPLNLLTLDNSSFEASLGNWSNDVNCAVTRDTSQFADGIASMKMQATAASTMQAKASGDALGDPRVTAGQTYTALASFKAATAGRTCAVGIRWMRLDNSTVISTQFGSTITDTTGGFTQASFTGVAPTGAVHGYIVVQVQSPAASGENHWVDKTDVHAGTSTTWTPGSYTNDQNGVVIERHEFLDDSRGPAYNWFMKQVASGGADTRNQGQGFSFDSSNATLEWQWLDMVIPRSGYTGTGMMRWTVQNDVSGQTLQFGADFYGRNLYHAPAVPNQAHTFSVWAWVKTGTRTVTPGIVYRDVNGTSLGISSGTPVTLTTTPQLLRVTVTAGATAALGNGIITDGGSTASQPMFFTTAGFGLGVNPVDGFEPLGLDNTTWQPIMFTGIVNTLDFAPFAPGFTTGQLESIPDYEYPPGRPVHYRAWIAYSSAGQTLRSGYSNQLVAYATPPPRTIIRSVTDNTLGCVVNRRKSLSYSIQQDAQVFHPLGADRAPVQIRDWVGGEDGTLELIVATEAQWQRVRRLIDSNDTLIIQWAQGGRSYVLITATAVAETISTDVDFCDIDGTQDHIRYAIVSLSYIETVSPNPATVA